MEKRIEKLDKLPYKASMIKSHKGWTRYSYLKGVYRKINGYWYGVHLERTLRKFEGKNVDKAFSHYCKLVGKEHQEFFWKEFNDAFIFRRWRRITSYWYVDDQKRVQWHAATKKRRRISVRSHDYKTANVNKHTGIPYSELPPHERIVANWNPDKYENRIIEGEERHFKYKGHKFKQYITEQHDKAKKVAREERKHPKEYKFKHDIDE